MVNAFASLKCSKKCHHKVQKPIQYEAIMNIVLISLRWQWQEVTNGNCGNFQAVQGNQYIKLLT